MKSLVAAALFCSFLYADEGFISVSDLKTNINNPQYVILDVCDPDTYKKGHIKNAVLVNVDDFRTKEGDHLAMKKPEAVQKLVRSLGINSDSKIVIYGHGNPKELLKESYLATALIVNGANDIAILNGGYLSWTFDSNILSSTTIYSNKDGNFTSIYNPDILVDKTYVQSHLGKALMLDARSPQIYYGIELSKGVKRAGHISHAVSSFWKDKFLADETLRSDNELKMIFFEGLNLQKDESLISYCTSGMEASMNWYILYKHFGVKNAKLYDASMREWGNLADTPMERFKWETFAQ